MLGIFAFFLIDIILPETLFSTTVSHQCTWNGHTGSQTQKGPLNWGLLLCSCHLEMLFLSVIPNDFLFELLL